ncbi:MAG: glycosyltransferase family 2 protein [Candidatus Aenigmatarchaeota archaeon]
MNRVKIPISIIIPTCNEEESIAKVLCSIPNKIKKNSEIIVVDSSKDMTPIIAKRLGARVIKIKKRGKGYAMKIGAKFARGDKLIFLDGDGTDPPEYIPKLIDKLEKYDLVLASRNLKNKHSDRKYKFIFSIYMPFMKGFFKILGFNVKGDPLAGFRAIRKNSFRMLKLKSNDFLIETEMNLKALEHGLKVGEISIPILPRGGGLLKSKLVRNPRQWIKIFNYGIRYSKDKIIKKKLGALKDRLTKNYLKILRYIS